MHFVYTVRIIELKKKLIGGAEFARLRDRTRYYYTLD